MLGLLSTGKRRLCLVAALALVAAFLSSERALAAPVLNGGFESGDFSGWSVFNQTGSFGNWFVYSGTTSPQSSSTIAAPPEGTYAATTDSQGPGAHVLYRDVALGAGLRHTLSFVLYYANRASGFSTPSTLDYMGAPNQQYRVDVIKSTAAPNSMAAADILANVFRTQVGDPLIKAPTPYSFDLTPWAGQTVRLRFAETDNQLYFQSSVDNVAIATGGKLEVRKSISPPTDPGLFNLEIDGAVEKSDASDGGTTGKKAVGTGIHTVTEAGGTSTSLSNYSSAIVCKDEGGTGSIVAQSNDAGPLDVNVDEEQDVVCTITNTRRTGKLEVKKSLSPPTDPGLFNLQVDGITEQADASDGGTTGELTVGTGTHTVGEAGGTGTAVGNYASSISCRDEDGTGAVVASGSGRGPLNVTVTESADVVCTITNTRNTSTLEVQKSLSPATDPGLFNLQIDGITEAANGGDGATTGQESVAAGTHTVGETAGTSTVLANYTSSISCRDQNGAGSVVASSSDSGPLDVPIANNDVVVCTITNTRNTGTIEVKKSLNPAANPGKFNLQIDGQTRATDVGNNGTTGAVAVNTGPNHSVGELAGTGTSLADYASSIACTRNGGSGPSGSGQSLSSISVNTGDVLVCTITNTRKTGKLEVKKSLSPTTDPGLFNLQIDGTTQKTNATDGGTTGEQTLNTGTHTVNELAGTGTSLSDYAASISCRDQNGTGSVVASGSGSGPLNVPVTENADIVCTITNTRSNGTIEVRKSLSPSTDPGLFDLRIDGTTQKTNATDGGTTGAVTVNTGANHSVSELAGTSTSLADYSSSISCTRNGSGAESGSGQSLSGITVNGGDVVVCTITNTRKTGKLEVKKSLLPATDPGLFNLQIDGGTQKANAGDGGTTGEKTLNTGTHTVGETAGTSTVLANYTSSISCRDQNGAGSVVASGSDSGPLNVPVTENADIVCTVSNTRKTGRLEVKKTLSPAADPGKFNLQIDGITEKTDATNGGTTGEKTLNTGTHSVAEAAGTGTSLSDYTSSISCRDFDGAGAVVASGSGSGPLNVPVTENADIVCTITNIRNTGTIEVKKSLNPTTNPGKFNLQIDGQTRATDVGNNGTTGAVAVNTGPNHSVGELAGTGTSLADYASSIACTRNGGSGPSGSGQSLSGISVNTGDVLVCTITNTRRTGMLEVKKSLSPTTDPGLFDLKIDGVVEKVNAANGGTTGKKTVNTGTHTVAEAAGTATALSDYTSSISCKAGPGPPIAQGSGPGPLNVPVAENADVVCTITNTRQTGTIEVRKSLSPTTDAGKFNLQIDGQTRVTNVGNNGTTGAVSVNTGSNHSVGELAGTGTSLSDYTSSIACTRNGSPAQSGSGQSLSGIVVANNDVVVCTITNTRNTGTIEVKKSLNPAANPGKFNLQIDGQTRATDVGNNGTTGAVAVNTGPNHSVGELAGTGTSLADYASSIACTRNGGSGPSGSGQSLSSISVNTGDVLVCTITNTRKTGKLEVKKSLSPTTDPGLFNLQIDGTTQKTNATDGGTTGEQTLNTGTHTVNELAGTGTSLSDYAASISCRDQNGTGSVVASGSGSGPLNVPVTENADIVCTITNTRSNGTIEVRKSLSPSTDPGLFDLRIDGTTQKTNATDGGTTGAVTVNTGANHSVSELAGTSTSLADYSSSISCTRNGSGAESGSGQSLSGITVNGGDVVVCTITNARAGNLTVIKDAVPNDPQDFDFTAGGGLSPTSFQLDDDGDDTNGLSSSKTFARVPPGSGYSISESTPAGWYLANTSCDDGSPISNIAISAGETVTCTIVNSTNYSHPLGASPLRVSLVPAFKPCETDTADSTHGAPLDFGSCSNPNPTSSTVTVGPDSLGFVRMVVCDAGSSSSFCNPPGGVMPKPDLRFTGSIRDVRCASTLPPGQAACSAPDVDYAPDTTAGPYTSAGGGTAGAQPACFPTAGSSSACLAGADLTAVAELPGAVTGAVGTSFEGRGIRITDRQNGSTGNEAATLSDLGFPIPLDCIPTAAAASGSSCGVNTTANALAPGVIRSGKLAVWEIGQIAVKDAGPDGVAGNSDDELFEIQGLFLP